MIFIFGNHTHNFAAAIRGNQEAFPLKEDIHQAAFRIILPFMEEYCRMVDYIQMMVPQSATTNILLQVQDIQVQLRSLEVIVHRIIIAVGRPGSQVVMAVHLDTITANYKQVGHCMEKANHKD